MVVSSIVGQERVGICGEGLRQVDSQEGAMKNLSARALWLVAGPLVGLVLVIGLRVDPSVIVFALGLVCGAAFGVPLTVVVTLYVVQQREARGRSDRGRRDVERPPVVVVAGGQALPQLGYPSPALPDYGAELAPSGRREFSIIGEETE